MRPNATVSARPSVIYMSYDGILEPLGESQVVAYLERLADAYHIHLVSFEKPRDAADHQRVELMLGRLRNAGITWHLRRYHKRPKIVSALWDMGGGMFLTMWLVLRHRPQLVHARSILCAVMLYPARMLGGARFLVDIRGFWADERVDGGLIRANGPVYNVLKLLEKAMLRRADHIVTLTSASVPILRNDPRLGQTRASISVIPTCADLDLFSPRGDAITFRPLTIGYVGQVGTWYMLEEMLTFFAAIRRRRPDARLLLINQNQQQVIREAVAKSGIDQRIVDIIGVSREAVPAEIRRMHAGLALIQPYFSKIASAPTKLAEYLGCGVPVVGNTGCGDMARIIDEDGVGVAMLNTGPRAIEEAADALLNRLRDPGVRDRCVASARKRFSIEKGVADYRSIYGSLIGRTAING